MPKLKAGTPVGAGPYSSYTAEQLEAIEGMKHPAYVLGIADKQYVNKVLHPDGTLSDDLQAVIDAVREKFVEASTVAQEAMAGFGEFDGATAEELQKALGDARLWAGKVEELEDHIGQKRFLFTVDQDCMPMVYFQCAVEGNPDAPARVADHPEPEAFAAHAAEVKEHIATIIKQARAGRQQ